MNNLSYRLAFALLNLSPLFCRPAEGHLVHRLASFSCVPGMSETRGTRVYGVGFDTENLLGLDRVLEFLSVLMVCGRVPWIFRVPEE